MEQTTKVIREGQKELFLIHAYEENQEVEIWKLKNELHLIKICSKAMSIKSLMILEDQYSEISQLTFWLKIIKLEMRKLFHFKLAIT